jgi:hypothetical protein
LPNLLLASQKSSIRVFDFPEEISLFFFYGRFAAWLMEHLLDPGALQ